MSDINHRGLPATVNGSSPVNAPNGNPVGRGMLKAWLDEQHNIEDRILRGLPPIEIEEISVSPSVAARPSKWQIVKAFAASALSRFAPFFPKKEIVSPYIQGLRERLTLEGRAHEFRNTVFSNTWLNEGAVSPEDKIDPGLTAALFRVRRGDVKPTEIADMHSTALYSAMTPLSPLASGSKTPCAKRMDGHGVKVNGHANGYDQPVNGNGHHIGISVPQAAEAEIVPAARTTDDDERDGVRL